MTNTSSYAEVLKVAGVRPSLWMQCLTAFNDNEYKLVTFLAGRAGNDEPGQQWYLSLVGTIHLHLGRKDSVLHFNELKTDGFLSLVLRPISLLFPAIARVNLVLPSLT